MRLSIPFPPLTWPEWILLSLQHPEENPPRTPFDSTLFSEGHHLAFPADSGSEHAGARTATLTVQDPVFWLRLALQGDLGFAEAYMYGEIDCEDLVTVFLVRWLLCLSCAHAYH